MNLDLFMLGIVSLVAGAWIVLLVDYQRRLVQPRNKRGRRFRRFFSVNDNLQ